MTEQNNFAIAELQQKANEGDAQAQFDLALCYANGKDIDKNEGLAFEWHKKAAEQGHVDAQFALGLFYLLGEGNWGKQQIQHIHIKWSNDKHILPVLGILKNAPNAHEFDLTVDFDPAIELAFTQACSTKGTNANDNLAFVWIKNAAKQNHAKANYWLGFCYQNAIGTQQNDELAFESFKKAAEQGYADAYYCLALCYRDGNGCQQNDELAFAWITKAVEYADAHCKSNKGQSLAEAYLFLGILYADGKGVAQSDALAFKWFAKAAEKELAEAQFQLASCYEHGIGVERNMTLAEKCYEAAFEQDYFEADTLFRLAERYLQGLDIEKNYELGMKWLREAAIQNHEAANAWLENALLRLAFPHLVDKKNTEEDYQFAFDWCRKEAEQDSAEAYLCLGILYRFGKGVEQNDERAFECFSKADNLYDDNSDINYELFSIIYFTLGICYAQGKGVSKDISKAELCFANDHHNEGGVGQILYQKRKVETVSNGNNVQIIPIPLLIVESLLTKNEIESAGKFVEETSMDRHNKSFFLTAVSELGKTNRELALKDKQLREAEKDLEDMMSMFAHKFRSPLDAIMYNTNHENIPKLYAEAAQTMRGLLDIFSTISTDDTILPAKIKADCQGNARLMTVLSKTLNMMLLHLLSASGTEKIHQHYLAYAKAHGKVAASVTDKEWYDEHFELEQALQAEWEQGFAYLLSQSAPLAERLAWLEQHFFKLELIGFDRENIQFKEYAVTESLLTILLNEILVNAFKYYSSETHQAVVLEWSERDGKQFLSCRNPSVRRERTTIKGSGKGHTFLSVLARKIGGQFIKPKPQDDFVLEFGIPNELLMANPTGEQ